MSNEMIEKVKRGLKGIDTLKKKHTTIILVQKNKTLPFLSTK